MTLVDIISSLDKALVPGVGIIVTTAGGVVSGELIPNWQRARELQDGIKEGAVAAGEEGSPFAELFRSVAEVMEENRDHAKAAEEASADWPKDYQSAVRDVHDPAYIHLLNARVFAPGQPAMPGNGMHWRGRLSEITGWALRNPRIGSGRHRLIPSPSLSKIPAGGIGSSHLAQSATIGRRAGRCRRLRRQRAERKCWWSPGDLNP
ncbi:hypothetical protein [Micromonospora sp. NPDC092111]|uniref:hypothetical protein n=1 Tax=Micromonospora sp. NPDC092111 TaxID=3364289 RepID=UPI0038167E63